LQTVERGVVVPVAGAEAKLKAFLGGAVVDQFHQLEVLVIVQVRAAVDTVVLLEANAPTAVLGVAQFQTILGIHLRPVVRRGSANRRNNQSQTSWGGQRPKLAAACRTAPSRLVGNEGFRASGPRYGKSAPVALASRPQVRAACWRTCLSSCSSRFSRRSR